MRIAYHMKNWICECLDTVRLNSLMKVRSKMKFLQQKKRTLKASRYWVLKDRYGKRFMSKGRG